MTAARRFVIVCRRLFILCESFVL